MDDSFFLKAIESKVEKETTRKNYIYRLNGLKKRLVKRMTESGTEIPERLILHIITHPRKYYPMIQNEYDNEVLTIKNTVTLILALIKYTDLKCKIESPYKKWLIIHQELCDQETDRYNKNLPSEKQRANYVTLDELRDAIVKLSAGSPHSTRRSSLQFCLLNMYLHIRPKRADFGDIRVYLSTDPNRKDRNYVVIDGDRSFFVLNKYNKTQRDGTPIVEHFGNELAKVFRESLKAHPRRHLFVGNNGEPFKTANAYSKFVTTTFKTNLGKSTGVSLLRHMFINEKVDLNKLSIEEKDAIATAMGHTRTQQEQYKLFFNK
jgi:hypothetical protein